MQRNGLTVRHRARIVVPGLELHLKQIPVLVERLGHGIGEVIRRVVADIDQVIGPHHGRNGPIDTAEERQRHPRAFIAGLSREPGNQRFVEIQEYQIVQLAGLVPRPLLGVFARSDPSR